MITSVVRAAIGLIVATAMLLYWPRPAGEVTPAVGASREETDPRGR